MKNLPIKKDAKIKKLNIELAKKEMERKRTRSPQKHPYRRAKKANKDFSWYEAAKALGVSTRFLKENYDNLSFDMEAAFVKYLNGD